MAKKGVAHNSHLPRLKKVEGQIRGIAKMVEEQRYCVDILTQLKAVRSALKSLEGKILEEHLSHCVHQAITNGNAKESQKMVEELVTLVKKVSS